MNKASLTAFWKATDRLIVTGQAVYVGPWLDYNRPGTAELMAPGYTLVNLTANYAVTDRFTVFARINNLLNQQYEDPLGFMRPGFGIYGGLTVQIGGVPSSLASSGAVSDDRSTTKLGPVNKRRRSPVTSAPNLFGFFRRAADRCRNRWSIGTFGAIAEFTRDARETAALDRGSDVVSV